MGVSITFFPLKLGMQFWVVNYNIASIHYSQFIYYTIGSSSQSFQINTDKQCTLKTCDQPPARPISST